MTNLAVRFGAVEAVRVASLRIDAHDRIGIVGPNGSGKSTLLRVLAGLLEPTSGRIEGRLPRGEAVLVHQHPYLFRGTAEENIAYALRLRRRPPSEARAWLERLISLDFANRNGKDLSGGERRRVALARALCGRPRLLLLDEPFAGLDRSGLAAATQEIRNYDGTLVIAGPDVDPHLVSRLHTLGAVATENTDAIPPPRSKRPRAVSDPPAPAQTAEDIDRSPE